MKTDLYEVIDQYGFVHVVRATSMAEAVRIVKGE